MIPIALTNATVDIETTSNVGVPGVYAFRVDRTFITQPGGMLEHLQFDLILCLLCTPNHRGYSVVC